MANARQVRKALEKAGWKLVRVHGSHHVYRRADRVLVLGAHDSEEIGRRLLSRIATQAWLSLDQFRRPL
ncbi:MAG: type II toxin-antitoxin system HicA family toxin [Candidatus Dormibacteraeota bacterium]|nr:type II toxin-antitoxin system HicA family toxin [Candidatus Dormibacteraeota bacterium]MBO0761234.1 type II toxin-antitoxin system HicA family toxin [Candidatus Dormibacteraeota bacterium]